MSEPMAADGRLRALFADRHLVDWLGMLALLLYRLVHLAALPVQ